MDKEQAEFVLDMLFVSRFCDDHEDCMNEILYYLTDDNEEFDLDDIVYAAMFAGTYHRPTSMEQESLNEVHRMLAWRHLNG
jgi:hypothetical protein